MLAKVAGSDRFKVGNGKATWSELPWQPNLVFQNGLIEDNGVVSVDFSRMPTDKFEALLKQLRIPIWLEQNTTFYVDGTNGSDVLSEGRGLSEDKPFKTIQACIDYVCTEYNFNVFVATIDIATDVYNECIAITEYTGQREIILDFNNSTLNVINNGYVIYCAYKWCVIKNLIINLIRNSESTDYLMGVSAGFNGEIDCYNVKININLTVNIKQSLAAFYCDSGKIRIYGNCSVFSSIASNVETYLVYAMYTNNYGYILYNQGPFSISGTYTAIIIVFSGMFAIDISKPTISGSATGSRYTQSNLTTIRVRGYGINYFPGSAAGYTPSLASYG